jgi:hypothetical protein
VAFEEHIEELAKRDAEALGMGGPDKLAKRKTQGVLNAANASTI